ncbi:glycosyl transferase group 1 [Denitrovibrio acetiphilus DSM 12809]|uniref:Glycosyl transferase group 1 n=1 Tax=Denitrovibrio acetiphilus (strain DSM 12809 / NBRC 114555 / N2460) TaxID=522772 RepID=D4H0Z4_DENA2|nr:glycosyltransferase family 4 protein [Denitrovibrio acetiphilus]ADD68657.1 glycosyl transferase group 1 [Denitrovibrio acetiphilus DSM 12809]
MERVNVFVKYFHNKGGGERICFNFVNFLMDKGVDVHVICGEDKLKSKKYENILTVTGLLKPGRYLKYSSFHRRAVKLAKKLDGIHFSFDRVPGCHIYRNGSGLHSSYVKNTLSLMSKETAFKKRVKRALDPVNKHLINKERLTYAHPSLRKVILNSEFLKREVLSAFPDAEKLIDIIPNGVNKSKFTFTSEDPFRDKYNLEKGTVCIGFAANNFQRKGLDHLLNAMAVLPDHYVLLVAGGRRADSYMQTLDELGLRERVFFVGAVDDMQGFYGSCDVFCMPSLYDSFGNVVPESLICGTPVVVSAMAGSSEIIHNGENGYVVETLTPDVLSDALTKAYALGRKDYSKYVMSESEMYEGYLKTIEKVSCEEA